MRKSIKSDVEKLCERYPDLNGLRGTIILFDDLETALGIPQTKRRFMRVIRAWWQDYSDVVIDVEKGRSVGVYVLTAEEQTKWARALRGSRNAKKKIWESLLVLSSTDPAKLNPDHQKLRESSLATHALMLAQTKRKLGTESWDRIEQELILRGV